MAAIEAVTGPTGDAPRVINGYQLIKKLGSGLQGKVYSARSETTGELVAVKLLDQDKIRASAKVYLNLQREITAMQRVQGHPHVIGLKHVAFDVLKPHKKRTGAKRQIMLVLELAPAGELFSYLMIGKFDEGIARAYYCQLMEALVFAHSKGVAHRDLKPENLLLDNKFNLRVGDWGLSAIFAQETPLLRTQCGTRAYMAPEVLRGEWYQGEAADVWSAGVLLFIMLAGFPPFQEAVPGDWWFDRCHQGRFDLFWAAHERSASFSPAVKDLINSIFTTNAARRYRLEDCLKHPWTAGGDAATPEAIRAEMGARRRKMGGDAVSAGSEAMDEVDAAEAAALAAAVTAAAAASATGGAAAGAASADPASTGADTTTLDSAATLDSTAATVTGAGMGVGMGMGMMGAANEVSMESFLGDALGSTDPFAREVTRGVHSSSEVVAAPPPVPAMPAFRPTFGPRIFAAPPVELSLKQPQEGGEGKADESAESSEAFFLRFAALASKAGIVVPDDAKAEEEEEEASIDSEAAAASSTSDGSHLTSFAIDAPAGSVTDASPAALIARAIAGYLDSTMQATVGVKATAGHGGSGGIKLKASIPPAPGAAAIAGGPIRCDVKLIQLKSKGESSKRFRVEVQRTGGDVLSFGRVYARLKRALTVAAAPTATASK